MYEPYTRQSLPSKEYRELLGSALCVFSSNNGFIIENIIHTSNAYDWYNLIDLESGKLKKSIADTISRNTGNKDIEILFSEIVEMRNRKFMDLELHQNKESKYLRQKLKKKMEIFNLK